MLINLVFIVSLLILAFYGYKKPDALLIYVAFFFGATSILKYQSGLPGVMLITKYNLVIIAVLLSRTKGITFSYSLNRLFKSKVFIGYILLMFMGMMELIITGNHTVEKWELLRSMSIYNLSMIGAMVALFRHDSSFTSFPIQYSIMFLFYVFVYFVIQDTSSLVVGDRSTISGLGVGSIDLSRLSVIAMISSILYIYGERNRLGKLFSYLAIIGSITTLLLSAQRGPIIGLFIALVFWLLFKVERNKYFSVAVVVLIIAGFVSIIGIEQFGVIERFSDLENFREYSRFSDYSTSFHLWQQSPVFGHGLDAYYYLTGRIYPHNMFLEVMVSFGIVGMIVLLIMLKETIAMVINILRNDDATTGEVVLAISWIAMFFSVQVSGSIFGNSGYFMLSALLSSMSLSKKFTMRRSSVLVAPKELEKAFT